LHHSRVGCELEVARVPLVENLAERRVGLAVVGDVARHQYGHDRRASSRAGARKRIRHV
jgi:hypothetical protein